MLLCVANCIACAFPLVHSCSAFVQKLLAIYAYISRCNMVQEVACLDILCDIMFTIISKAM